MEQIKEILLDAERRLKSINSVLETNLEPMRKNLEQFKNLKSQNPTEEITELTERVNDVYNKIIDRYYDYSDL